MVKRTKKRPLTSSSIFDFYNPKETHTTPDASQMNDDGGKVVNDQSKDEADNHPDNTSGVEKKVVEN
ncbi:hypothetical protein Metho_1411 [Methanomethylovorans hollandica DSM 15978]|jgi:hypothetical protein|uniref:Uncharacterized protein n=1 Tax=Methanomethylovorans hollandica (strain DSM 15978 / NBRC 107637 / DMS1) TaxID=867904 RepID=L0KY49_METHD|nr:hypothetical protein [Methanomethylovorans hollandica]AGB49620.1 hypothetical protein Metho_1411 [Methanomethylovorans hollandica DSM 15978]